MINSFTKAEGVAYIRKQLIEGLLNMKEACRATGWSFPRIRSQAITICKKLSGTFEKIERGIYMLQPIPQERKDSHGR